MVRLAPRLRPLFPYLKTGYVRTTRAVAPLTTQLSRVRGGHLPTGVAATLEQAAVASGGAFALVRPTETVSRPRPEGLPARHPSFASTEVSIPAVGMAALPGGRVLGPHRAVISGTGELVHDISYYFGTSRPSEHPLYMHPFPADPHQVDGRLGVLASRGDANYYHFLVDCVTRLGVAEQCKGFDAPDRWYVPAGASFQREVLAMFGVGAERVVDADTYPHVRAEVLVVPGLPATQVLNPPWAIRFLRERMLTSVPPVRRSAIYVSRGPSKNNRSVQNEEDVVRMLSARGFTYVNPATMSVAEQIRTFAEAHTIVAPHGAGLTNIIFASPGTRVVELFPDGRDLQNCYWQVASAVGGLDYRYLGGSVKAVRGGLGGTLVRDMTVDLDALTALLD